ncbi:DUF302 domain-containing protein [Aquimarina sp. 2201CG1-2-11]|uniref:DUF302 domain-containing protein n=1 Tax=Aquimarina discodermiae TaxID=3231043 RepID=UPI0034624547
MTAIKEQDIITKTSSKNFEESYNTLVDIITNNPNLKIVAQLDHQANASSVGLQLNPTRLILFGNPQLGTPLMQKTQLIGLDLPQKILIWEDDHGEVKVSYNNPEFLKSRHNISNQEDIFTTINNALGAISNKVIAGN